MILAYIPRMMMRGVHDLRGGAGRRRSIIGCALISNSCNADVAALKCKGSKAKLNFPGALHSFFYFRLIVT